MLFHLIKTIFSQDTTFPMSKSKLFTSITFVLLISISGITQGIEQSDSTRIANQPNDTTILAYNKKQYNKMISKGDVLFSHKDYLISKKMYKRAIRFQPNWDNTYPKKKIIEIDKILSQIAQSIEVYVKEYDDTFQQGITEERKNLKYNNYNEIIAYQIIRVVVIGENYAIYKKHVVRSTVTYSKNGIGVPKLIWDEESNNINLRWN